MDNSLINYIMNQRRALLMVALISIVSLKFAFISQYVFGYDPCILCLYQRWPFAFVIFVALFAYLYQHTLITKLCLMLSALAFFTNSLIAFFHVGVEQKWWVGFSTCGGDIGHAATLDELKQAILNAPVTRCDEVDWTFIGLSMATYNVMLCLGLALFCLIALLYKEKKI